MKKVINNKTIIILSGLLTFLFVFIFKDFYFTNVKKTETKKEIYYNVDIYGYFKSSKEDEKVSNHFETKTEFLTRVEVKSGNSLEMTLRNLDNCPGEKTFCENPIKVINEVTGGAFYYNDFVKNEIKKENDEDKKFWKCFNKAKSKKEKEKCGSKSYFFTEHSSEYKFSLTSSILKDTEILVDKAIYEN